MTLSIARSLPVPGRTELPCQFGQLVGHTPAMRRLFALLSQLAGTEATVLIRGETGTGKELVAHALHEASPRARGPFEVIDCASLVATLAESELFGHERGAFTGASSGHAGAFARAHGGTIFLDEIGELPLALQPRLLRVLEKREVRRVGGSATTSLDLRVLAATHRDLAAEVRAGRFREDLYYRLAVVEVVVPPLRARLADVELLVARFQEQLGLGPLPAETLAGFRTQSWPGNVRELRNAVERAGLGFEPEGTPVLRALPADGEDELALPFKEGKQRVVDAFEERYLRALLERHPDNFSAAARAAGVDRMALRKLIERCQ
jgi:DNA-binding NtrC family response regulator